MAERGSRIDARTKTVRQRWPHAAPRCCCVRVHRSWCSALLVARPHDSGRLRAGALWPSIWRRAVDAQLGRGTTVPARKQAPPHANDTVILKGDTEKSFCTQRHRWCTGYIIHLLGHTWSRKVGCKVQLNSLFLWITTKVQASAIVFTPLFTSKINRRDRAILGYLPRNRLLEYWWTQTTAMMLPSDLRLSRSPIP